MPPRGIGAAVIFLSVVVHGLQIVIALPLGQIFGFTKRQTLIYTIIFGATWWRPLQIASQKMAKE